MDKELPRRNLLVAMHSHRPSVCLLLAMVGVLSVAEIDAATKAGEPPAISMQPIGRNVTDGGHVALSVFVDGTAPFFYQWWKNDQPLTNHARLAGATNAVLNISPVQSADSGDYSVVITNADGAITSAVVSVVVNPILFTITAVGGTGALVAVFGEIGDVYRIEMSTNFFPYVTNGYATNMTGRAEFFDRDTSGGFRQLRVRFDHMLPVLYTTGTQTPNSLRAYGRLNQVWRFEGSSDLRQWAFIQTVTNTTGWVRFNDPPLQPPPIRFYRLAPP